MDRMATRCFAALLMLTCIFQGEAFGEEYSRIGVSIGGIHLVGVYFERHFGDNCARAQLGYNPNAVSLNLAAVRYIDYTDNRPYVGIGFQKHLDSGFNLSGANLICFPLGIDFALDHRQFLGAELVPALSFSAISHPEEERKNLFEYILPLPSFSYKYRL